MQEIILVDKNDKQIGVGDKLKVHQQGQLHRAFSIFIFNNKGELLLQKRAKTKYHSPGLWSNTCCSHPQPNKDIKQEAEKRLQQEMGFSSPLKEVFTFHYKAQLGDLIENEIDHVFIGTFNGTPLPNPSEAGNWRWISPQTLQKDIQQNPTIYTPWLQKSLPKVINMLNH